MRGGKTVEVMNTDAEGRLVMADAIVRAGEESPDAIVDIATLTGAQLVALGSRVYAVMSNDDDLRAELVSAAGRRRRAELADAAARGAAQVAGLRGRRHLQHRRPLRRHARRRAVPAGVRPGGRSPWAHLDIAGPAWNEGEAHGYTPKGGTGVPVRTLVEWLEGLAADTG